MRYVIWGDVHGCLQELDELLYLVDYKAPNTILMSTGDAINRGPDSVGVIRRLRELDVKMCLSNHENHFLRWYKGNQDPHWLKTRPHYAQFSDEDVTFMNNLPLYLEVKPGLYAIHAGVKPNIPIDKQQREDLLYLRYTDKDRNTISLEKVFKHKVAAKFWTEFGPFGYSVIYGHAVFLDGPRIDKFDDGTFCIGIDGGCCFGGTLQALILKDNGEQEVVKVKAKQIYYKSKF